MLIMDVYLNTNVARRLLGVGNPHIEVFIGVENARIENFIFGFMPRPFAVFGQQHFIGKFLLWVFIQILHIVMRGNIIDMIIQFLYIFSMVAFIITQSK